MISMRRQSQDYVLHVPEDVEFAVEFRIPKTTGPKFKALLQSYGLELTRIRKKPTYEANEKKKYSDDNL